MRRRGPRDQEVLGSETRWGMGMALFLSTIVNKVDRKGRVSVPAAFRAALTGEGFSGAVLFPSISLAAIEGWGMGRMEQLSAGIDALNPFSDERDAFAMSILAAAHQLPFDTEGRVVLSPPLIEHANLGEHAAFVGRGSTFQIWEPVALRASQEEARKRARADRQTLKLRPEDPGS